MTKPFLKLTDSEEYFAAINVEAVALGCFHLQNCLGVDGGTAKQMLIELYKSGIVERFEDDLTAAVDSATKRVAVTAGNFTEDGGAGRN